MYAGHTTDRPRARTSTGEIEVFWYLFTVYCAFVNVLFRVNSPPGPVSRSGAWLTTCVVSESSAVVECRDPLKMLTNFTQLQIYSVAN